MLVALKQVYYRIKGKTIKYIYIQLLFAEKSFACCKLYTLAIQLISYLIPVRYRHCALAFLRPHSYIQDCY